MQKVRLGDKIEKSQRVNFINTQGLSVFILWSNFFQQLNDKNTVAYFLARSVYLGKNLAAFS